MYAAGNSCFVSGMWKHWSVTQQQISDTTKAPLLMNDSKASFMSVSSLENKPITNSACCRHYSLQATVAWQYTNVVTCFHCCHPCHAIHTAICSESMYITVCLTQANQIIIECQTLEPSEKLTHLISFFFLIFFFLCVLWRIWNPVEDQGVTVVCYSKCIWQTMLSCRYRCLKWSHTVSYTNVCCSQVHLKIGKLGPLDDCAAGVLWKHWP